MFTVMAHDKNSNDTAPEPDSPRDNDILFIDWVSSGGSTIEARVDRKIWLDTLVNGLQHNALKLLDDIIEAHGNEPAIISLFLCSNALMQQVNYQHRQVNKPTNVLSFPSCEMPVNNRVPGVPMILGDILIAAEITARDAEILKIGLPDHLIHLFVHGLLHLFGHDHVDAEMAETMESLEIKYLAKIGVANPYQGMHLEFHQ